MKENKYSYSVYTDLDWNIVIEDAYTTLTSLAVEFLPTQEAVDLMVSVIDEAKKLDCESPLPASRTSLTALIYVINCVTNIINSREAGLATDTTEYKMFADIHYVLFAIRNNPPTFESFLTPILLNHVQ